MILQKILNSLILVTFLVPVSNSMNSLNPVSNSNNIKINNNYTPQSCILEKENNDIKHLQSSNVLDNANSLKLSGVFDSDCNHIKYNTKNINKINKNQCMNNINAIVEKIASESSLNNNDPAINNNVCSMQKYDINKQIKTNPLIIATINFVNKQVQVNNNKEDAANAKPNENKFSGFMNNKESIQACNQLRQRIINHIFSKKFKWFGKLHKEIMQDGPNEKICKQFNLTPDILKQYSKYYNEIVDNIKSLLPSKLGESLISLPFFEATHKTGEILVKIYNKIENTAAYDPNDEDDINETIRYIVEDEEKEMVDDEESEMVDDEEKEIKIDSEFLSGKNILRILGNLAAALSDLCLYTQPTLFQLALSIGEDDENFKFACQNLLYIGELFGIQELIKKPE